MAYPWRDRSTTRSTSTMIMSAAKLSLCATSLAPLAAASSGGATLSLQSASESCSGKNAWTTSQRNRNSALRRRATEEKSHQKLPVSFERVSAPHLTEDSEELSSEDHDRSSAAIVPENCNRSNVRHQQCTSTHEEDGDMYPDYLSSAEGSGSRSGASEDNDDSDDSYDKEGDIAQAVDHHDHHHPYSDGYVGSASAWKATKTRKLASSASFGRPSYKHHHPHQVQHSNIMMSRSYSTSGAGLSRRHRRSSRPQLRITAQELANIAAGAALALAVLAPLAQALSSHWQYFVAGGICAAASHTAAVPLDVIKTRIQCSKPGEYRGTWDALVRICRSEGCQVLFCGAGATLIGYAMQGFLKFGFFEFLKPVFSGLFLETTSAGVSGLFRSGVKGGLGAASAASSSVHRAAAASSPVLGALVAASITAEIVGSAALTPLEAARIRMVSDRTYAPGLRAGIARMISEEGFKGLTRGLPAVLAKQVPYTVTKLVTFDVLSRAAKRAVSQYFGGGAGGRGSGDVGAGRIGVGVNMACAVVAGALSSLASQPGDSLLSALHSEGRSSSTSRRDRSGESRGLKHGRKHKRDKQESVVRAMVRIARKAGILGLFRGAGARMMHVTSIVTVQLLIYQYVKELVGIVA